MKGSGINYFYDILDLDTGSFAVFYTFENGVGDIVSSVPSGQAEYSGILNDSTDFWNVPGSGYFNGNSLSISNASGLQSSSWTDIFVYEKVDTQPAVLFDSLIGRSGYRIGITESNKPYFEGFNQEPVIAGSNNNYSSKNAVSFTYLTNYVTIGYYNFNTKQVEAENFTLPFEVIPSDDIKLANGQFTGYMDTYIHLNEPIAPEVISQLLSGLWAIPTGTVLPVSNVCVTGITGYQEVFVGQTGVTGYEIIPGGDLGQGFYTGQFPTYHTTVYLTGYLSSGLFNSGVSGNFCYPVTGAPETAFEYLTGYASSFGMQKVEFLVYVGPSDIIKQSVSRVPFESFYNIQTLRQYSGYQLNQEYTTGQFNEYLNGLAQAKQGWILTGAYIIVSGAQDADLFFFDNKDGNKIVLSALDNVTGYSLLYSGQEIYLNGLNLISGYDFVVTGGNAGISLTDKNTGIGGFLFEYPIVLTSITGNYTVWTGENFWRNTTNLYQNGLRQVPNSDYVEGALIDLYSGNSFNPNDCSVVYGNTNLFWEV